MKNKLSIERKKVLLSTGELTDEIVIKVDDKTRIYESCPQGATTGNNEAKIISTEDKEFCTLVNGLSTENDDLKIFDESIPNTIGANISTPLSLAFLKYLSYKANKNVCSYISSRYKTNKGIPSVICNILNGGKHAGNKLEMCEFMIIPKGMTVQENILIASQVYLDLKNIIIDKLDISHTMIGREGGLAPKIDDIFFAILLIQEAIDKRNSNRCDMAIDVAANNFSRKVDDKWIYEINEKYYESEDLVELYKNLITKYPSIVYLEDPFNEDDKYGWKKLMHEVGHKIMIVADDLTVTNKTYINENIGLFNAIILKTNQVGTFSALLDAYKICKNNNIKIIVSQRSGETDSSTLAHIAVGLGSEYMKAGAPARERIIKYNELLRISEEVA